jgi:hypothetical protein
MSPGDWCHAIDNGQTLTGRYVNPTTIMLKNGMKRRVECVIEERRERELENVRHTVRRPR